MLKRSSFVMVLAAVIILVGMALPVMADLISVSPVRGARYGSWGANLYSLCTSIVPGNNFVAFVNAEEGEYRVVQSWDVRSATLGILADDVTSAVLKWKNSPWGAGRSAVTVDQVGATYSGGYSATDMYGHTIASDVYSDGWVNASPSVDITAALKTAMQNASATEGLSYRWYNDNDTDPTSPYSGISPNYVVMDTGFVLSSPVIEITYVPEPATLAFLALGGLAALKRR